MIYSVEIFSFSSYSKKECCNKRERKRKRELRRGISCQRDELPEGVQCLYLATGVASLSRCALNR
jgi:hypothetical protein